MESNPFPDLVGSFEIAESIDGQLDDASSVEPAIMEKAARSMHWRVSFKRVQYGTFHGAPVCLVVVEGKFHAEDRKRHRFTWARISAEFEGGQALVEVLNLAPERAHGTHVEEERMSHWGISSTPTINALGTPGTISLFSAELGHSKKYSIDLVASMQGSRRGFPKAKEAVWTLEEAKEEGIPWTMPSMVMILKCSPEAGFFAKFNVQAKINASFNPLSWFMLKSSSTSVPFDGKAELIPPSEKKLDINFTMLDISKLTKLDFSEKS